MSTFNAILEQATRSVSSEYFQIQVMGKPAPIFRERVYCYELYHQLRSNWGSFNSNYKLCGEVDKSGHPILRNTRQSPDFLVHVPGEDCNMVVIEVKPAKFNKQGLIKDLQTIHKLMGSEGNYERGICLIYGNKRNLIRSIEKAVNESNISAINIEIWHHPTVGEPARHIEVLGTKSPQPNL
ncbi:MULTISPECIES: hypothetical protein [Vibrio]|uniref:hypothetical protein n=1 Tax=Vibrio TaxID=662 RepID=UPI00076B2FB5|nr:MULTISPECIES: hypothetical protein [Vibrio]AMG12372.1 methionyl-tRNA formyltransferase-like protein [Vibrio vulnificus]TOH10405.1 methionyl-tRNA formyltransferase-like protein [Vibrio parahaemolyticus]HAS8604971.1 methionyl-tRNA formyltransferase-like protein [Vibrio vulnificus]